MNRLAPIWLCLLLLVTQQASGDERRFDTVDAFIHAALKRWEAPGVAIAVVKDGQVTFLRGYGHRAVDQNDSVDEYTLFDIASLSKSFTAASVAVLVDRGELHWDDRVTSHAPEIQFPSEYMTQQATLRDLLCHRTGLQLGDLIFSQSNLEPAEQLRRIRHLGIKAPFRSKHTYNNLMYALLRDVVARVSKRPWPQLVTDELLAPLAMHNTMFEIREQNQLNFAPRHWRNEGQIVSRQLQRSRSIYSCAHDMANWIQLQLAQGQFGDQRVLSDESIREMHALYQSVPLRGNTQENPYAAKFYGTGLGWFVLDYRGQKLVMHTGAWGAIIGLVPEENLGVVVLSNLDWDYGMTGILMYHFLDSYCAEAETTFDPKVFDQPYVERPGQAYQSRDRARIELDAARDRETKPTHPLSAYAGRFRSPLFGDVQILHSDAELSLRFGRFTTKLVHWENDVFYARAPTQMNFDWLVRFNAKPDGVNSVVLSYVGWYEPDALFQRAAESN